MHFFSAFPKRKLQLGTHRREIGPVALSFWGVNRPTREEMRSTWRRKHRDAYLSGREREKQFLILTDIGGELLIVSQFTLYADTQRGNRPSYGEAAPAETAKPLYDHFVQYCRGICSEVQTGIFGAHMRISLINEGPITILCSSDV